MAMQVLMILTQLLGIGLFVILLWGVPAYFIWQESRVSVEERKLWVAASIVFPWLAFFAFMLVAPIADEEPR